MRYLGPAPTNPSDVVPKSYVDLLTATRFLDTSQTGSFTATAATLYVINYGASLGNLTITLPAAPAQGTVIEFYRIDTNSYSTGASIVPGGTDTWAFGGNFILAAGMGIKVVYSGTKWVPISNGISGMSGSLGFSSSAAFPPNLMARDSGGRSQVSAPSASGDITNKAYVDALAALKLAYQGAWSGTPAYSANDVVTYNGNAYICTAAVTAAAATTVVGSSTYSTDTASNYQMNLPAGAASGDSVVWLISECTSGTSAQTMNTPTGATKLNSNSAGFVSTNEMNSAVFLYTLTAGDITNGYLSLPNPASGGTQVKLSSALWVVRNLITSNVQTAKAASLTTPSVTTTQPSMVFHVIAETLQGGAANTETCTGTTAIAYANAISPSALTSNHVSAVAYETQSAAGATTGRAFAGTISAGSSGTESYQVAVQANAGTNPAPDTSSSWQRIGSTGAVYEQWTLATGTAANGATLQLKGSSSDRLIGASNYNSSTGAWTAPYDAEYEITLAGSVSLASGTASTRVLWTLATGAGNTGTILARGDAPPSAATNSSACGITIQRYLIAGTTIYAAVAVNGGTQTITTAAGFISFRQAI